MQQTASLNPMWAYVLSLTVLPWLVYAPSMSGEFVYDDIAITVVENPFLRGEVSWLEVLTWERPVREFTYQLDHLLWGMNPVGYHIQNRLWHGANVLLLFGLCLRLGIARTAAWAVALLFALHPIQSESVAWISGRKELLCLCFQLLALHALLASYQSQRAWLMLPAALAFVLALFSKQVAVVFPFVAALLLFATHGATLRASLGRVAVFALIALIYLVFASGLGDRLEALPESPGFYDPGAQAVEASALSWGLTPLAVFDTILGLFLAPVDLTLERAFPPVESLLDFRWVLGLGWLLTGTWVCVAWWNRDRLVAFGWGWMLLAWFPVSGVLPLAYILADRYLYIPSAGFLLAAVGLTHRFMQHDTRLFLSCTTAVAITFGVMTTDRAFDWRTEVALWESSAASRPANPRVFSALGNAYQRAERMDDAFAAWQRSLDLNPRQPNVWLNLGLAERQRGNLDEAEEAYRTALEILPTYGTAMYNLAFVHEMRGDVDSARDLFVQAARTLTGEVNQMRRRGMAHYQAARLFAQDSDWAAAQSHLHQAEAFAPRYAPVYTLKGQMPGTPPALARQAFQQALALDPESAQAWFNLGVLEWQSGNPTLAQQHWVRAIELGPALEPRINAIRQKN